MTPKRCDYSESKLLSDTGGDTGFCKVSQPHQGGSREVGGPRGGSR